MLPAWLGLEDLYETKIVKCRSVANTSGGTPDWDSAGLGRVPWAGLGWAGLGRGWPGVWWNELVRLSVGRMLAFFFGSPFSGPGQDLKLPFRPSA